MILVASGRLLTWRKGDAIEHYEELMSYSIDLEAATAILEDGNITLFVNDLVRPLQRNGLDTWQYVNNVTLVLQKEEREHVPTVKVSPVTEEPSSHDGATGHSVEPRAVRTAEHNPYPEVTTTEGDAR